MTVTAREHGGEQRECRLASHFVCCCCFARGTLCSVCCRCDVLLWWQAEAELTRLDSLCCCCDDRVLLWWQAEAELTRLDSLAEESSVTRRSRLLHTLDILPR